MPIRIDRPPVPALRQTFRTIAFVALAMTISGCGREPTEREVKNARAFEALLTAVSLKNAKEVEADAELIEQRHAAGELSDGNYRPLRDIIAKARARDWTAAEKQAYEFRSQFGDRGAFFK